MARKPAGRTPAPTPILLTDPSFVPPRQTLNHFGYAAAEVREDERYLQMDVDSGYLNWTISCD
jgi:hypothetical protein